jgi:hypothetical protein
MFKLQGILFHVGVKQTFGSNMVKKEFIISRTGAGAYPNIVFEILGDKDIAKLDAIQLNSHVEVTFDIHGKSYTKDGVPKYFNVLRVSNIEKVTTAPAVTETANSAEQTVTEKA